MAKKAFKPIIGDLESLSQQERENYVVAACEFLGVPSDLGVVGLQYMDSGDGKRNLVLYVKRGATDIIRGEKGIDVDSMEPVNGDGYVGWKVTGHDKNGRHEIAVGTVSTKGLAGKAAADSVMVAQTKALRRMTLQFAGGGFLDSSELDEKTTDIANASLPLAQIAAQPSTTPNIAAGKDITTSEAPSKTTPDTAGKPVVPPAVAKESEQERSETPRASEAETGSVSPSPEIPKPRRKRRSKETVSLDLPSEVQPVPQGTCAPEMAPVSEQKPGEATAVAPAQPTIPASDIPPPQPANMQPAPQAPSDGGVKPTEEQLKGYMKRLSEYVNDILPKAGFMQSEGETRNAKIGRFFKTMFPRANTKNLSVNQWISFFEFMDGTLKLSGAEKLVQVIDAQLAQTLKPEGGSNA